MTVTENEYWQNEQCALSELAEMIQDAQLSGLSLYALAKATGLKYDTVLRASKRIPIRVDSERRIRYYLTKLYSTMERNKENEMLVKAANRFFDRMSYNRDLAQWQRQQQEQKK